MSRSGSALTRVLVTGATGTLGRHVVAALEGRPGVVARAVSRRERPTGVGGRCEWVQADLVEAPLDPALRDVDAVIHLASAKGSGDLDVVATRRLLTAAHAARVRHLVVISIIGCDRIPLPFYASKRALEDVVRRGPVPWTIVRTAQFDSFVERLVASAAALPIPAPILADLRFQPVDEAEVAASLVETALGPPAGDAPELAGPELLSLGEVAAAWLAAAGRPATLLPISLASVPERPGATPVPEPWVRPVLDAYARALNAPHGARTLGQVRFSEWLARRASSGIPG